MMRNLLSCTIRCRPWLLAGVLALASLAAQASILVTDLQGEVMRGGKPLDLLSRLLPQENLHLGAGARAVVAYVSLAREYVLTGPGDYRVESQGMIALPGASKMQTRELPAVYRQIKIDLSRLGQAGVRLRGDDDLFELHPSGLLAQMPTLFQWPAMPGAESYVFRLADAKRNLIYEARLHDPAVSLPANLRLKTGARYYWGVEAPGSGREASWTQIRVAADAALAKRIVAAQPAADAPRSERVLYALIVESRLPD